MVLSTLLILAFLRKRINLRLDIQAIAKSLVAGGVMALVLFLIQIPLYNKFFIPVYVVVGTSVYLVMLRLLKAIRSEDIDLMQRYFGARLAFIASLLVKILVPRVSLGQMRTRRALFIAMSAFGCS